MHWDHLFEDLEGQLASEWESERAALDAEAERLRISRIDLRARLRVLCGAGASASIDIAGAGRIRVRLRVLGADWTAVALAEADGASPRRATRIVPLHAITGLGTDHGQVLASLEGRTTEERGLQERMTLGFVLRDLARRRAAVRVLRVDGSDLHGTIDRAGVDHLDLAVHDAGSPRTVGAVQGFSLIPFPAIAGVQIAGDHTG